MRTSLSCNRVGLLAAAAAVMVAVAAAAPPEMTNPPPSIVITNMPAVVATNTPPIVISNSPPADVHTSIYKLSELLGHIAESNDTGQPLGFVSDLALDFQASRVACVVINSGPAAGDTLRVVPPGAMSPSPTTAGGFALDTSSQRWQQSPVYERQQLLGLNEQTLSQQIYQRYNQRWPGLIPLGPTVAPEAYAQAGLPAVSTPTPTGRSTGYTGRSLQLRLTSDIIGRDVITPEGGFIGRTTDVVVDFSGRKAAFVIVTSAAGFRGGIGQRFAVPTVALSYGGQTTSIVVSAPQTIFESARALTDSNWPLAGATAGSPEVFRYHD